MASAKQKREKQRFHERAFYGWKRKYNDAKTKSEKKQAEEGMNHHSKFL